MNRLMKKILTVAALGSVLFSGASVSAMGLKDDQGNLMSQVTDLAGSGEFGDADGAANAASFRNPERVAIGADGTVYVSDTDNQLIRVIKDGHTSVLAGTSLLKNEAGMPIGALLDGIGAEASFSNPQGLDVDAQGNVYVADTGNHAIRKIAPDGTVTTVAGNGMIGDQDGKGAEAAFDSPQDVAVADDGTIYVADTLNHAIRKIAPDGAVTTLNAKSDRVVLIAEGYVLDGGDYVDGALSEAKFNEPSGLALDAEGNLYVSDTGNQLIRYIDFEAGQVTTAAGRVDDPVYAADQLYAAAGYVNGRADEARFNFPKDLAVTSEGGIVIADSLNHAVRYLHEGQVSTIAGSDVERYGDQNGINGHNLLHNPGGAAVAKDGSIVVADAYNNQVKMLKVYAHPEGVKADGTIHVVANGSLIDFDAEPEMIDYRTMIPVRAVSESLGYELEWSGQEVTIAKDGTTVRLTVGSTALIVQQGGASRTVTMDTAPYNKDNRVYVPLRFFSEELGSDVQWDASTSTAILRDKLIR